MLQVSIYSVNLSAGIGLQGGEFDAARETGALLGYVRQLAVAEDAGIGVLGGEVFQQLVEGVLLGLGASVGWMAVLIKTALIDYAQRTVVVMAGMDALDGLGQQRDDIAIAADIVMVRALTILGLAAGNEVLDTEGLVAGVGHAVNDDEFDRLQRFHTWMVED